MKQLSYYDIMKSNDIIYKEDIRDVYQSGEVLGDLVLIPNHYINHKSGMFEKIPLTERQVNYGFKGSFIFRGTNIKYFNHLFNSIIIGKYSKNNIYVDSNYSGLISSLLYKTIQLAINLGTK